MLMARVVIPPVVMALARVVMALALVVMALARVVMAFLCATCDTYNTA